MGKVSIKYLIREGFRSLWTNRMMSVASIAVLMSCLILMGCSTMAFANIETLVGRIEEQNVVMVFIEDGKSQEELAAIDTEIKNVSNVKDTLFVSGEDAWQEQLSSMSDAQAKLFQDYTEEQILPDSYKVTVNDMSQFNNTINRLKTVDGVETVRENSALAQRLVSIRHGVTLVAAAIIVILFAVSMFIIANTIKLTMYSRRLEINIMKSVGATDAFVRIPFVVEGVVLGVIAGVVSLALVWGVYAFAAKQLASLLGSFNMTAVPFAGFALPMLGAFVLIGVLSGTIGSLISMRKYLRKEGSEISAI